MMRLMRYSCLTLGWWTLTTRTLLRNEVRGKHSLPMLPYGYNSLEPVLCREIMEIHHKKHHSAYVENLNSALTRFKAALAKGNISDMVALEKLIRFNGGGHINHSIYWTNYSPQSTQLEGELLQLVKRAFGSEDAMKERMLEALAQVEGSGWVWLAYNPNSRCLLIKTTVNQDPLLPTTGLHPLLGIDAWEHAYYLQYLNEKKKYATCLLDIINWDNVRQRYLDARCGIVKNR